MGSAIGRLSSVFRRLFSDLGRLFFPATCTVCQRALVDGEKVICLECLTKMPVTNYHLFPDNQLIRKLVDTRAPIERAAAFFEYRRGNRYSMLVQDAKYGGHPEIGREIARIYASQILPSGFFNGIDAIIPVPVHWSKHFSRGFSHTDYIAEGLSLSTGIPVMYNLKAARPHATQTRKTGKERRNALSDIFSVDEPDEIRGLHILLVDDVITTGSTILNCARAIHDAAGPIKLSVLSLASTRLE